jgi:fumarylacetoacetate (FAA) hydrolase family protein
MNIADIVAKYRTEAVKTAGVEKVENTVESAVKTAHENGAREAENMMKVAAAMGDVIGNRIADIVTARIAESFGYDPEVMKTASLQDVLYDTITKVAEQVTGNTAVGGASSVHAERTARFAW